MPFTQVQRTVNKGERNTVRDSGQGEKKATGQQQTWRETCQSHIGAAHSEQKRKEHSERPRSARKERQKAARCPDFLLIYLSRISFHPHQRNHKHGTLYRGTANDYDINKTHAHQEKVC